MLKYGCHNKSFILNAPLISCPIPVIRFGWVCCCTHPERMNRIGQLTRGAFRINDLLWNPYFSNQFRNYESYFSLLERALNVDKNHWPHIYWFRHEQNYLYHPKCTGREFLKRIDFCGDPRYLDGICTALPIQGGFQLLDLIITELRSHITC